MTGNAPSERGSFRYPSERQIAWAQELGVDIPKGISARGLGVLIDKADRERVRCRLDEMDIKPGERIKARMTGTTYVVREIDDFKMEIKAFNESIRRVVILSSRSVINYYQKER